MEAVIYARVSTARQEEGTSLDTQVEGCLELAESMGYSGEQIHILRDQGSGDDPTRPGMLSLKSLLNSGEVKHLFVFSPDRIARDPSDLLIFRDYLDTIGVDWHFFHGPQGDSPETRLMTFVFGYSGQRERMGIIERTRRGKGEIAHRGRLPIGTGKGLFGYDYEKQTKTRRINDFEAEVVRWMFHQYAEGQTEYSIAVELNREGMKTKRGAPWHAISVKRLLQNPAYKGETWYGKARHRRVKGGKIERTPLPQSEWILVEGFTPAIMSDRLHRRVQERQAMPKGPKGKPYFQYLLAGFIECALCGARVSGQGRRGRPRNYRCRATNATAVEPATCNASSIPADPLEAVVWEHVSDLISNPALIAQSLNEHLETDSRELELEINQLERKILQAKGREGSLIRQYADGQIDDEMLNDQIRPIKSKRDQMEATLLDARRQQAVHQDMRLMDERINEYCRQVREGLETETFDGKRAALTAIGAKVVVSRKQVILNVTMPPEFIAKVDTTEGTTSFSTALPAPTTRTE